LFTYDSCSLIGVSPVFIVGMRGGIFTFAPSTQDRMTDTFEMDETTKMKWYKIVFALKKDFGKKPDMNGLLFLIGMRELGKTREFTKDEKMDLMHIGTCALMAQDGYYELESYDNEGWPHYVQKKQLPYADLLKQETFLRKLVVRYFEANGLLPED